MGEQVELSSAKLAFTLRTTLPLKVLTFSLARRNGSHQKVVKKLSQTNQKLRPLATAQRIALQLNFSFRTPLWLMTVFIYMMVAITIHDKI